MDQAATLRKIVHQNLKADGRPAQRLERMRSIAIASGKGGVGKTNTALNLALALSRGKRKVLLVDGDLGLANIDVLLGLTPRHTLEHVIDGRLDIMDVMVDGPFGLKILPSASGIGEMSELSREKQDVLFRGLRQLDEEMDYLIIDTGAGISSNVLRFSATAGEVVVVVNAEPTSLTDAFALMKLLSVKYQVSHFHLIANSVASEKEGGRVFLRLKQACNQFLSVRLDFLGAVPTDKHVRLAVRQQKALLELYPNSPAGMALRRIAVKLDQLREIVPRPSPSVPSSVSSPPLDSRALKTMPPQSSSSRPMPLETTSSAPSPVPRRASSDKPLPPSIERTPPQIRKKIRSEFWDRLLHWKKVR